MWDVSVGVYCWRLVLEVSVGVQRWWQVSVVV